MAGLLADRLSPDDRDQLRAGWDEAASMPDLGFSGVTTIRGPLGIAATVVLVIVVLATGALSFALILAVQSRRRSPNEDF